MDIPYEKLGAIERPKDERDFPIGAAQVPTPRPRQFLADLSAFKRNYQGQQPACGPHGGSHLKQIDDDNGTVPPHYTPNFTWIKLKDPSSPVYDNHPISDGTDMRSLLQALRKAGSNAFEPLQNKVALSTADYADAKRITPEMTADAGTRLIESFAFGNTDFESICQYIFQNKAVILLIKCDEGFWGTTKPTFTTPKWGHFICAMGYDEDAGFIRIIDSADPDDAHAIKNIDKKYFTPEFILECGTVVNIAPSVKHALSQGQIDLAQKIIIDIQKAIELVQQELKGRNN